jgi:hypothetical protein
MIFNFQQPVINNMVDKRVCEVGVALAPINLKS